ALETHRTPSAPLKSLTSILFLLLPPPPTPTLFPYTTLFRSLHPRPSGLYQPSPLRSSFGGTAGGGVQRVWSGAAPPAHPLPGRRQHNTPCSNRGSDVCGRGV